MIITSGTRLGPYVIDSELGSGGMGVVYRAHDPRLERLVAIKLLPRALLQDGRAKRRFLQEARRASTLDHPNICTIHDINETPDGQLFLVMACYSGQTLNQRLEHGPLQVADAVDVATQVARGLSRSHAAGIIHCDIKPANLMLTIDGIVKILDFGVARLSGMYTAAATDTRGSIAGTLAYMSPEQTMGAEVDARTDLWALGVVLYEMLTGVRPFGGENLFMLAEAIRTRVPRPLSGEAASLTPIVERALAKDREARFASADDFARALTADRVSVAPPAAPAAVVPPAPAPSSSGAARTNLPRNLPSLVGRSGLVERVRDDVKRYSLVTLVGFGGVGKTRLAQQVGTELQIGLRDGVWFVDLSAVADGMGLFPAVARGLGVREISSESLLVTLVSTLRERSLLVILDNCEQLAEPVAALVEEVTAAAPDVRFLATSRVPLGVYGERVCRVEALDEDAAVALFEERAAQTTGTLAAEQQPIRELCRRLDCLPLAIELAAARVRSMTPAEILARVDERFSVLRVTDRRATRHRTLEAMVEWSYALLAEPERCLLNRLSVFVGSFDLTSAEQVCADRVLPRSDIVEALDRLVDQSLVSPTVSGGKTRYRLLETVRAYADRQLDSAGEREELFDRHARYFSRQAQTLSDRMRGGDLRRASAALAFDIDNVTEVLERLTREGRHADKSRLVSSLQLFWMTGAPSAGRQRFDELVAVLDQLEPQIQVSTLTQAADVVSGQGFASHATALLARARAIGDGLRVELPPYFYYVSATVAELDNRPDEVIRLCDAGLPLAARLGDDFMSTALRTRVLTSIAKESTDRAFEHVNETLVRATTLGQDLFVAVSHMLLGTVHMLVGQTAEADAEFDRAIELAGFALPQVPIAAKVGSAAAHRHVDAERSLRAARDALAVEEQSDVMPSFRALAADIIAWHWARAGRSADAVVALTACDELRRRLGFAGVWWGQPLREEAWDAARRDAPAERMDELVARGRALAMSDWRRLLLTGA